MDVERYFKLRIIKITFILREQKNQNFINPNGID